MLGCRQKLLIESFNTEGTTTKAELDERSKQLSLVKFGEAPWNTGNGIVFYGGYDRWHWKIDNATILKRLIEKGLIVRVSRGVYRRKV